MVDDDDYEEMNAYNWTCNGRGYAARSAKIKGVKVPFFMHRCIMDAPPDSEVDHINGNRLDNRKENLRLATRSQNRCNCPTYKSSSTGVKGVTFHKHSGQFRARIQINGDRRELGGFGTLIEAEAAYDKAALLCHGEFALTNAQIRARANQTSALTGQKTRSPQRKHKTYGPV